MMVFASHDELAEYIDHVTNSTVEAILTEQDDENFVSYQAAVNNVLEEYGTLGDQDNITEGELDAFIIQHADLIEITPETYYEKMRPGAFTLIANENRQFAIVDTIFTVTPDSIIAEVGQQKVASSQVNYSYKPLPGSSEPGAQKTTSAYLAPYGNYHGINWTTNCGSGDQKWKVEAGVGSSWYFLYGAWYTSTYEYRNLTVQLKHFKRGAFGRWYAHTVYTHLWGTFQCSWVASGTLQYWNIYWNQQSASCNVASYYGWKCNGYCPYWDTQNVWGNIEGVGQTYFSCTTMTYNL